MQSDYLRAIENEATSSLQSEYFLQLEENLLKEALRRTHKEQFLFAIKLYKIQKTMQRFSIVHKSYNLKKS